MNITLSGIGKKFNRRWIFKDIDFEFIPNGKYAILGSNGSGKSTLLQMIAGHNSPSKGTISYSNLGKPIEKENIFNSISLSAPYLDLPEELTFPEILHFHSKFKKNRIPLEEILKLTHLTKDREKQIRYFSSGMRQRAKLALALCFDSQMVLLDEPTSHLDANGQEWYRHILHEHLDNRLLIIASNDIEEYSMCDGFLKVEEFHSDKKQTLSN